MQGTDRQNLSWATSRLLTKVLARITARRILCGRRRLETAIHGPDTILPKQDCLTHSPIALKNPVQTGSLRQCVMRKPKSPRKLPAAASKHSMPHSSIAAELRANRSEQKVPSFHDCLTSARKPVRLRPQRPDRHLLRFHFWTSRQTS